MMDDGAGPVADGEWPLGAQRRDLRRDAQQGARCAESWRSRKRDGTAAVDQAQRAFRQSRRSPLAASAGILRSCRRANGLAGRVAVRGPIRPRRAVKGGNDAREQQPLHHNGKDHYTEADRQQGLDTPTGVESAPARSRRRRATLPTSEAERARRGWHAQVEHQHRRPDARQTGKKGQRHGDEDRR